MIDDPARVLDRLMTLGRQVRQALAAGRSRSTGAAVRREMASDLIYGIDAEVEPLIEAFCADWGDTTPLVLIAEGLLDEDGREADHLTFPRGTPADRCVLRLIVDPIDGTRGLMHDKRSAWSLAGVAANRGPATRLRDIDVAAMTELPTSKAGYGDVLGAIRGRGVVTRREALCTGLPQAAAPPACPSQAADLRHGFASVVSFFPGTKELAARLMERIAAELLGPADVTRALVFDDQYISTGGQFHELITGRDRFCADLRPAFYAALGTPAGLCCHPYDCAAMLVAEEAGVILTGAAGAPLDGPLDTTTPLDFVAYANDTLRRRIEPVIAAFLKEIAASTASGR